MWKKKIVGLINVDSKRIPNLALMKIAAWHRKRGDEVRFIDLSSLKADRWYGSKIFMGGSGFDVKAKLPDDIELMTPDYDLFNTDYSIGFTSRGCVRNCDFCIVREKEGSFYEVDFSKDIKHSKYLILDNSFLSSKIWKEKLNYFIDNNIKVNFNQGLDIRQVNDENAEMLSRVKYYCGKFRERRLYFAFDNPDIESILREKLKILLKYIKPRHLMFYVLVGHNTKFDMDIHRFNVLLEFGVDPYVQIYNNRRDKPVLRDFARWVNKRVYKTVPEFKNYSKYYRSKGKGLL